MAKQNMLKNLSSNVGALMLVVLAGCSTAPVTTTAPAVETPIAKTEAAAVPPATAAATTTSTTEASTTGVAVAPTVVAKPVVVLASQLQGKFNDGVAALDAGQYERALQSFAAIQIAQPDFPPAYLNAALAERGRGKLDAARTHLDAAVAAGIKDARVYALTGLIERERGQFAAAKSAYEDAIKTDAAYAPAYRNLAVLADLYLHDAALAYHNMEKYVQMTPDDKQASGWLAELKRRAGVKTETAQ